ncbi:MAG TPA: DNA-directed RNA polymerase subunit L [archaeon]|nr:DNA-directed RNA polymerase subunit L [archaeon]
MELEVVKKEKNSITIQIKGENDTLVNLLREELWNDKNISEAAVLKDHPFTHNPKILVNVNSGDPVDALQKAVDRIKDNVEKFRKAFDKAV